MKSKINLLLLSIFFSINIFAQSTNNVKILELTNESFKQKVWNFEKSSKFTRVGNLPIIIDFHATWCRPCKMLAPHLQAIQNKYKGKLVIYKIDVDDEPELARKFKVEAMPTIVFIDSKSTFKTELGYKDLNDFEALVSKYFFKK